MKKVITKKKRGEGGGGVLVNEEGSEKEGFLVTIIGW